jgi:hypothetical protein
MQLAVLLSLLLNLGVEFWLYRTYLDLTVESSEQTSEWIDETEIVTLPDYSHDPAEEVAVEQSIERPVETAAMETMPQPVERQQVEHQPTPADRPAAAEPARQAAQPSTNTLERAPSPTAAPRRSELRGGQVSRQSAAMPAPPREPIPQPSASAAAPPLNNSLEAAATAINRQQDSTPQLQRRTAPHEVADARAAQSASPQAQRAERSETAPQVATASPLGSRQAAEPSAPATAAPTAAVAAQAPAAAASLEPATAQAARQQAATPAAAAQAASSAEANIATAQVAAATIDRADPQRDMPSASATASRQTPLPRTSAAAAAAPQMAQAIEQAAPTAAASGEAEPLQAAPAADVTRQAQTGPTARRSDSAVGRAAATGQQVARSQLRRAAARGEAVDATSNSTGISIARATGAASTAPTMAEMPSPGAAVAESTTVTSPSTNGPATSAGRSTLAALPAASGQATSSLGSLQGDASSNLASQARRAPATGRDDAIGNQPASGSTGIERAVAQAGSIAANGQALTEPGAIVQGERTMSGPAAQVAGQARQSAELPGALLARGNTTGTGVSRAPSALPGLPNGLNRAEAAETGPQIAASTGASNLREAASAALPAGLAEADDPGPVAGSSGDTQVAGLQGPAMDNVARRESGLLPTQIAAEAGPGGLSHEPTPHVGLPNRRARLDSEAIHQVAQRFLMSRSSTTATIDGKAFDTPSPAFNQRAPKQRDETARSRGGSSGSERAVEMGLDYLARQQLPDGRWSLQNVATGGASADQISAGQMQADTAATGMALLCFLGAGYTHTDGKYRDAVAAGLAQLVSNQKENGDLFSGGSRYVWFYSHGIAAIALCEAYGMTGDRSLRAPAQRALDFIVASQHPVEGGWRYSPGSGTDTSVSGWQMMALKSGELAGLNVPAKAYDGVRKWLDIAQGPSGTPSKYSYRPASNIPHQRQPSTVMTAEGLLMRLYTGWPRNDPRVIEGAEFLKQHLPAIGTRASPQRDAYYWYYATQLMFQVQGEPWNAWNERMRAVLLPTQVQAGPLAGSWNPRGQVNDRWGVEAGRIYVTAMHLLMLEVYYRHLPLYQTLE